MVRETGRRIQNRSRKKTDRREMQRIVEIVILRGVLGVFDQVVGMCFVPGGQQEDSHMHHGV